MSFGARTLGYGSAPFTPVQRTYTSGTTVTETAPVGATNVIIAVWGGGGGGARGWTSDVQSLLVAEALADTLKLLLVSLEDKH